MQPDLPSTSRYVRTSDPRVSRVLVDLPGQWWSRPYEYAWAQSHVEPAHVVLDAACGIMHPFKLWLAANTAECHACDHDPRLADDAAIWTAVEADLGDTACMKHLGAVNRTVCDITALPYPSAMFHRVFCISVLEHLAERERSQALRELIRVVAAEGLVVLTVDVPPIDPRWLLENVRNAGGAFAGSVDPLVPADVVSSEPDGRGLQVFRALLRPTERACTVYRSGAL